MVIWAAINYRVSTVGKQTIVEIGAREGEWTPPSREMVVQLVNVGEQRFQDDGTARWLTF
jgi:alpha-glucosidase